MKQYIEIVEKLKKICSSENVEVDVPMKNHITFRVGGKADIMVTPDTFEKVKKTIELCKENNIEYYVLGKGSNVLVKDNGIRGVVIKLTKLNEVLIENNKVIAGAGASLIGVSLKTAKQGLTGLEFASGIPGTIGGAVAMNAGAYGGEISDVIESVKVVDDKFNIITLNNEQLELSYRDSIILRRGYVVLEVTLKLENGDIDKINSRINDLTIRRKEKQPLEYPSAGSTFKRPEGYYASKLIQDAGLKGHHVGEAEVSMKHSGFIINKGNASADDVLKLIKHVQMEILEKYDVNLETEVKIIGEE